MKWHAYSYKSVLRCWWYISLRFTMSERRANFPCRQLNSEKIKGAALCYLSPIVVDKCSVVTCKCTCNMDEGLQKAWNEVCRTRDACDKALQGLYSKWIEMSIINPYYESIGWIRKPDFDIIFCRSTKCGLFLQFYRHTRAQKNAENNLKFYYFLLFTVGKPEL